MDVRGNDEEVIEVEELRGRFVMFDEDFDPILLISAFYDPKEHLLYFFTLRGNKIVQRVEAPTGRLDRWLNYNLVLAQ